MASAVISFVVRPRVKVMTRLQNGAAAAVLCEGEGGGELYNFTKLQSTAGDSGVIVSGGRLITTGTFHTSVSNFGRNHCITRVKCREGEGDKRRM